MENILMESFDEIKFSALSKCKEINPFVTNVTIGPNRTLAKDDESSSHTMNVPEKLDKPPKVVLRRSSNTNGTTLIINQLRTELEKQRNDHIKQAMDKHIHHMMEFSQRQERETKQRILMQQQLMMNRVQQQELMISNALEQFDKDTMARHQQLEQYYKELAERTKRNDLELQEKERRKQQLNSIIDRIKADQVEFRTSYQDICNMLKHCSNPTQLKVALGDTIKQLKSMPESMEEVVAQCRNGVINENVCLKTNKLVHDIKDLLEVVELKVVEVNAAEEKLAQPPPELPTVSKHIEIAPRASIPSSVEPLPPSDIFRFVSKSSLKIYSELQTFMETYQASFKEFASNESLKQFRFGCKKAVNIPVNAISAISVHHLNDKYNRLSHLLNGKIVEVGGIHVCAANHPQGVTYCTNLLAHNFVCQGDLMVSGKPEAAFSYATVIVTLWNEHADFGKLLLAHFYTQCPYLVPIYPPRTVEQTDQQFYQCQGYRYIDGAVEKQDKFLNRMAGIMRLYAAIIIAQPKRGQTKHPYSVNNGWRWLASFVNLEPKPDITATLLHVFLETVGARFEAVYGKSYRKLMIYICQVYLPMIQKIDFGGPVVRLEVLLQGYIERGYFELPSGILAPNFW